MNHLTTHKKKAPAKIRRSKPVVIDFHAHIAVPEVLEITFGQSMFARAIAGRKPGSKGIGLPRPALDRMSDMRLRFKEMDAMGIDIQIVSPSILQQCTYWARPQAALEMERKSNDRIAEAVAENPDRLAGIGSVPLLKRFHYETVLFNPDMLDYLATRVPTRNIMMGTDYPFGERNPVGFVRSAGKISRAAQDAILGANAARFLGIEL